MWRDWPHNLNRNLGVVSWLTYITAWDLGCNFNSYEQNIQSQDFAHFTVPIWEKKQIQNHLIMKVTVVEEAQVFSPGLASAPQGSWVLPSSPLRSPGLHKALHGSPKLPSCPQGLPQLPRAHPSSPGLLSAPQNLSRLPRAPHSSSGQWWCDGTDGELWGGQTHHSWNDT